MSGEFDIDGLIGARVSLRQQVGARAGRPLFSDAVGDLVESDGHLVVETRRGRVAVDRSAVVAARAVPPAVPGRAPLAAVVRLESLCADAWPAVVEEPLGAWRLRAAGGWTGRANSALAIGDPGMPVADALVVVERFAERTGTRPRVQVPVGSPWDRAVAAAGWVLDVEHAAGPESAVLVTDLAAASELPAPHLVEIATAPAPDWFAGPPSDAARHVLTGAPRTAFALVRGTGSEGGGESGVLGRVRATVVEDHLHISVLHVVEAARRAGLATGLLAATAAWGRRRGARWGVLQVALHNNAARTFYDRIGAVHHHDYRYLVPPA